MGIDPERNGKKRVAPKRPERLMAKIVSAELGVTVSPEALRKLLAENWGLLSFFAHVIHEQEAAKGMISFRTHSSIGRALDS